MNIKYILVGYLLIALTYCLLIGCKHNNPLLTTDGITTVKSYFEVMGDNSTRPCMYYFAEGSTTTSGNECKDKFMDAYKSLRRSHPDVMQNVKPDDFLDPVFWQTLLGINK